MAYYLLYHKIQEREFLVVPKEVWTVNEGSDLFTIIVEGDEDHLLKLKEQLEKEPVIYCARKDTEPSSPPLAKISRVMAVTSSGNTKFSYSSEFSEPFKESEEEYIPDPNGDSSSSDDYPVENKSRSSRPSNEIKRIKKVIDFDVGRSSMSVESTSQRELNNEPSTSQGISDSSRIPDPSPISGEVTLHDELVGLDIFTTVHSGKYTVSLETLATSKPDSYILKGSISQQSLEDKHKCHAVDSRKPIGYVIREEKKKDILIIRLEYCVQQGRADGRFTFVEETQMHFSHLKFDDPYLDEEDYEEGMSSTVDKKRSTKLKQHCCFFCKQKKTCIWRHITLKHADEDRVKEMIEAFKSKDETEIARAKAIRKDLRVLGDRKHNENVPPPDRIPAREHKVQMISNSVHCTKCGLLIAARNYCRHERRCTGRPADGKRRLRHLQTMERMQMYPVQDEDKLFATVISGMKATKEKAIVENDPLLKSLAIYLVKAQPKTHNLNNTRSALTRLARLFLAVQTKTEDKEQLEQVKDMFKPHLYGTVTSCIRDICCFDQPYEKRKSQLALAYGPLLTRAMSRLTVDLLKSDVEHNDQRLESLSNLAKIHEEEFKIEVTRQAIVSTKHKRMSKSSELPSAKDISLLMQHVRQVGDDFYNRLKTSFDSVAWINLGKSLLCQLLVFNRRRVGEMSRANVENFENRKQVTPEYYKSLTMLETMLANTYSIFTIMAKRNRPVSLLITKTQIEQLELLLQYRNQAGIPDENRYLFATPHQKDGYLKASNVLRSFAYKCGAEKPELLKSTNLRKQVATMSQLFCLSHMDIEQLAAFLGHDRTVHESYYRLDEQNSQITKLSKFLNAVGDNSIFEHKGKTLDELPVHLFSERPSIDTDDSEDSGEESDDETLTKRLTSLHPSTSSAMEDEPPKLAMNDKRKKLVTDDKPNKSYKLRRRSHLKIPLKLQSPGKQSTPHRSPAKSPFTKTSRTPTTKQLLYSLEVNGRRRQAKRPRWTKKEKDVLIQEFGPHLQNGTLPSNNDCVEIKNRYPDILQNREPHSIYCWVQNNMCK